VGEGTADKQRGLGAVEAHRVADLTVQQEGFAHVVQQHEQDHQAAQGVDGKQALAQGSSVGHGRGSQGQD